MASDFQVFEEAQGDVSEPRAAMSLEAGTKLGPYEIQSPIGAGGMGQVYKARDTRLDRTVAVKVLSSAFGATPARKQRLIQEAHAASALNHPNIVAVYDIGQQDGADFIVMEYVEGRTLDQLIPREGMKINDLLHYAISIADALARAHSAGIIHRDLKPGNLMVTKDGQIKLLDFGLAKWTEPVETGESAATATVRIETEEGAVLGTVAYMSPEQAEGRRVDSRSDIFSFGAMLYEMATGHHPFSGSSKLSTMAAILNEDPKPPHELASGLPRDLDRIILRCLRKDPAWRYQSAADLKISLADLQRELASGVATEPTPIALGRSGKLFWVLALIAGAVLGAGAMWWSERDAARNDVGYFARPLTTYSGLEKDPALSPDGKQVAFSWNGPKKDNFDIYVQQVAGGQALRLTTDAANDVLPTWSPDGDTVAFVRSSGPHSAIYSVRALGGMEHKLFEFQHGYISISFAPASHISWSPDGRVLAFSGAQNGEPSQIWILDLDTREARSISRVPNGWVGDGGPSFSPDGKMLAYVRRRDLFSRAIVFQAMARNGSPAGSPREMTDYTRMVGNLAWLPDERSLAVGMNSEVWSTIWRFTPGKGFAALGLQTGLDPSVAIRGQRMAYTSFTSDLNIYRLDGPGFTERERSFENCHVTQLIDSTVPESDIMLSRDGSRLAFVAPRTGYREVYVANADGSNQESLTSMGPASLGSPRWSPDGRWIVFDRYENGHSMLYVVRSDGGQPRRLTNPVGGDTLPSWSSDGKWIYFNSNRGKSRGIWKIAWANPETAVQVTTDGGTFVFESSDGKQLFYSKGTGIWSVPVNGGEAKAVVPNVFGAMWAVAGRSIYFVRNERALSIWVLRLDTGRQFEYVRFPGGLGPFRQGTALTVSQDEKFIYYTQLDRNESDLMLVENFR